VKARSRIASASVRLFIVVGFSEYLCQIRVLSNSVVEVYTRPDKIVPSISPVHLIALINLYPEKYEP